VRGVPYAQYPAALAGIGIACCPLSPGTFNASKSPQKAWEHALTGACVVASPTVYGEDPAFVENGGLLAAGADEWEHHLSRLLADEDERRDRADRLAAWVLAEKTLETNLHRWPDAWREIVAHARR
jgi:hypothetical protein